MKKIAAAVLAAGFAVSAQATLITLAVGHPGFTVSIQTSFMKATVGDGYQSFGTDGMLWIDGGRTPAFYDAITGGADIRGNGDHWKLLYRQPYDGSWGINMELSTTALRLTVVDVDMGMAINLEAFNPNGLLGGHDRMPILTRPIELFKAGTTVRASTDSGEFDVSAFTQRVNHVVVASSQANLIPEPATAALFGAGLVGLMGWRRRAPRGI